MNVVPGLAICVRKEDTSHWVFDPVQRMVAVDLLGPEAAFREAYVCYFRIICIVCCTSHISRLEDRPKLFEQSLMVAQMVRIHLIVASSDWQAFWSWDVPHHVAINQYSDWRAALINKVVEVVQNAVFFCLKRDSFSTSVCLKVNSAGVPNLWALQWQNAVRHCTEEPRKCSASPPRCLGLYWLAARPK